MTIDALTVGALTANVVAVARPATGNTAASAVAATGTARAAGTHGHRTGDVATAAATVPGGSGPVVAHPTSGRDRPGVITVATMVDPRARGAMDRSPRGASAGAVTAIRVGAEIRVRMRAGRAPHIGSPIRRAIPAGVLGSGPTPVDAVRATCRRETGAPAVARSGEPTRTAALTAAPGGAPMVALEATAAAGSSGAPVVGRTIAARPGSGVRETTSRARLALAIGAVAVVRVASAPLEVRTGTNAAIGAGATVIQEAGHRGALTVLIGAAVAAGGGGIPAVAGMTGPERAFEVSMTEGRAPMDLVIGPDAMAGRSGIPALAEMSGVGRAFGTRVTTRRVGMNIVATVGAARAMAASAARETARSMPGAMLLPIGLADAVRARTSAGASAIPDHAVIPSMATVRPTGEPNTGGAPETAVSDTTAVVGRPADTRAIIAANAVIADSVKGWRTPSGCPAVAAVRAMIGPAARAGMTAAAAGPAVTNVSTASPRSGSGRRDHGSALRTTATPGRRSRSGSTPMISAARFSQTCGV